MLMQVFVLLDHNRRLGATPRFNAINCCMIRSEPGRTGAERVGHPTNGRYGASNR